jgi:DnaJ homologue, subfamily C, member 28, conserved domain
MTERKPPGQSFPSWIDQQIQEATERGAFDDLPGAGKPLPQHRDDDGQRWIREKLRREGIPADELLPPPLKLRKDRARLLDAVPDMASEQDVRDAAAELNRRIAEWRRIPVGPPVFVPLVHADELVARWRAARPTAAASDSRPSRPAAAAGSGRRLRRRWPWQPRRPGQGR